MRQMRRGFMKLKRILSGTLAFNIRIICNKLFCFAEDRLPAFPGAEGGGMYAQELEAEILL